MQAWVAGVGAGRYEQCSLDPARLQEDPIRVQGGRRRLVRSANDYHVGAGSVVGAGAGQSIRVIGTADILVEVDHPVGVGGTAQRHVALLLRGELGGRALARAGAIDDVLRTIVHAPEVRHADVGLDHVHGQSGGFLQARDAFRGAIGTLTLVEHHHGAEQQEKADQHGDHQLDQADAALPPPCDFFRVHGAHLRSRLESGS